jgi:hypothetical protein
MVNYNNFINKKGGIIPIKEYQEFYKKFGTYLKTNNEHMIFSNHKVTCPRCSYHYPNKAITQLNLTGIHGDAYAIKKNYKKKCPKCGHLKLRIEIVKIKTSPLKGMYKTVFVCAEVKKLTMKYKTAEKNFITWLKIKEKAHLAPSVNIIPIHFDRLPDTHSGRQVERFVKQIQGDRGLSSAKYQVKSHKKSGFRFITIYL